MNRRAPTPAQPQQPRLWTWLILVGILLAALVLLHPGVNSAPVRNFTYTSFVNEVSANKVSTATITPAGAVSGKLDSGEAYTSQIPTALDDTALSPFLLAHNVQVTGTNASTHIAPDRSRRPAAVAFHHRRPGVVRPPQPQATGRGAWWDHEHWAFEGKGVRRGQADYSLR